MLSYCQLFCFSFRGQRATTQKQRSETQGQNRNERSQHVVAQQIATGDIPAEPSGDCGCLNVSVPQKAVAAGVDVQKWGMLPDIRGAGGGREYKRCDDDYSEKCVRVAR